ncbi:MAG: recombinase family protein [Lachnospiraceae bacterium]|jgi:site-specific DNA recombinase|nr:recombinase family protein [Lachnospiraceae bacterium]
MLRAVIYCRCSTEEESQADALRKQAAEARECVEKNKWILVDEYVESKSGTSLKGRREYRRLFDDIGTGRFDIVVIKSQDRLMRNTKDWYLFLDRLLTCKKQLYLYLERRFYSADDSLLSGIKAILAEEYSRELSKKIVNAHTHRQRNGGRLLLTNQVFGFQKQTDGGVRIVEEEARILRKIYAACAAGHGSRAIAAMLKEEGVQSKKGNFMTPATIRRMIRNPLYKGTFVMNRRHFDFETKRTKENPREEWIFQKGAVPAIVEEALWGRANEAMSARAKKNGPRQYGKKQGGTALSGGLICKMCGAPYYRTARRSASKPRKTIYEWKCSRYLEAGRAGQKGKTSGCSNSHLDEEIVFGLLEGFCAETICEERRERLLQRTMELLEAVWRETGYEDGPGTLERQERLWEEKKGRLLDKLLEGVISDADYKRQNERLEEESARLLKERLRREEQGAVKEDIQGRLEKAEAELREGGFLQAAVSWFLKSRGPALVHEWKLELRTKDGPVFVPYPFPPNTNKGRCLDRGAILAYLMEQPQMTAAELAEAMKRSPCVVRNRMKELERDGFIQFEGVGKGGSWKVLKAPESTSDSRPLVLAVTSMSP